ncbi:unnamed protein product [Fraxinus pennsylvanica]|uniref:Pentatricopeptide repeat-containing protein n=1 Tax=Fraxinus pennsylvanica TaxID=56036 RepID=A0AAD2A1J7_9LAMI|nr:unnamed protein product [Fraxinus pennsylvanica]
MASIQLLQATVQPSLTSYKATALKGLESCSTMAELKQCHAQLIKLGLSLDNDAMGRVIKFCAISKPGELSYALKVFDCLPNPDTFIYNTILRGYLQSVLYGNVMVLYTRMLESFVVPNKFTFPPVIRACCINFEVKEGKQVHAHVMKLGFGSDSFCQNNLIHISSNSRQQKAVVVGSTHR